ncbi:MAG: hypothetical protein HYZ15_13050 [Sphingobacteriales bacterium]|nr:hypothetical protein [Sphingobacteriales bacterium]
MAKKEILIAQAEALGFETAGATAAELEALIESAGETPGDFVPDGKNNGSGKPKKQLIAEAEKLGYKVSTKFSESELEELIAQGGKEPENYYFPDDAIRENTPEVFQEADIMFDGIKTIEGRQAKTFIVFQVKRERVLITAHQAAVLNLGVRQNDNRRFSLYLKPGTTKVEPFFL